MSDALLHLLPLWTPSRNPRVASIGALFKVQAGGVVDAPSSMELRMLDQHGRLLDVAREALRPSQDHLSGPGWLELTGNLVHLHDETTQLEGVLGPLRSERIARSDALEPVTLVPIPLQLDLPGEPHLGWQYVNTQDGPVDVDEVFGSTRLHVDGATFAISRHHVYNGPARLPPGRGLVAWWSLDAFDPGLRRGSHHFSLEILGRHSRPFEHAWDLADAR